MSIEPYGEHDPARRATDLDASGALDRHDYIPAQPQWLLTGYEVSGGVMVLAAAPLTVVGFERRTAGIDRVPVGRRIARIPRVVWTLHAQFQNPVNIMGASYAEALDSVRRVWTPPDG